MSAFLVTLFLSIYAIFFFLRQKLLALLMLELSFLSLIFLFFFFFSNELGGSSVFAMMLFLGFLVLDSVLGLCCLVLSSRNSTPFSDLFFVC